MTKEDMLTEVIRKYGFEANETIDFANNMEHNEEDDLDEFYEYLMNASLEEEEDDAFLTV